MLNHRFASLAAALAAVTVSSAGIPTVSARSQSAISSEANAPSESSCWSIWYTSKTNTCTTAKLLYLPAVLDATGSKAVVVTAYGATAANNVGCIAYGVDTAVTSVWTSGPIKYLSAFGIAQDIVLPSVNVPPSGNLYVHCQVSPSGRVHTINFNP